MPLPAARSVVWSDVASVAGLHLGYFEAAPTDRSFALIAISPDTLFHIHIEDDFTEEDWLAQLRGVQSDIGERAIVTSSWVRSPIDEHVMWVGFDPNTIHTIRA